MAVTTNPEGVTSTPQAKGQSGVTVCNEENVIGEQRARFWNSQRHGNPSCRREMER